MTIRRLRADRDAAREREEEVYEHARPLSQEVGRAQAALAVVAFEAMRAGVPAASVIEAAGFEPVMGPRLIGDGVMAYLRFTYPDLFGQSLG